MRKKEKLCVNKKISIVYKQKDFLNLANAYRRFEIFIPFKSFKYCVQDDYFYILLECNFLPRNFDQHFNENLFLITKPDNFLTPNRFHCFVHMDKNEKVVQIFEFSYYHNLFLKDFKTNNSKMSPHTFTDMENFHLKLFCLEFEKKFLRLSKGDFILFNLLGSDCFLKRFVEFLPEPLKRDLGTFLEKDYSEHSKIFLLFFIKIIKVTAFYVEDSKTFVLLNVKWVDSEDNFF